MEGDLDEDHATDILLNAIDGFRIYSVLVSRLINYAKESCDACPIRT